MKYDTWTTQDGRHIKVVDMTDLHVIHTIRAIEEGRLLDKVRVYSTDLRENYDAENPLREPWLTVLKGEALKRGLDWSTPPTRKVSLFIPLAKVAFYSDGLVNGMLSACQELGIAPPMVDVCNKTGKVTYLHWATGKNVGTPVSGS